MKYEKTLSVIAGLTFAGAISQAQIAVGENLTISGFVDASYTDKEVGTTETSEINVDQVEIDFDFSFETVTASVQLQANGSDSIELEQAYLSTNISGVTLSAGRMLNLLGFESDEPTGLYQFSTAYSTNADDNYNPGSQYNDGIRAAISQGDFAVAASILDNVYATDDTAGGDAKDLGYEIALTYTGVENLSISLGYADDGDVSDTATGSTGDGYIANIVNIHAAYSLGQLTLAGEYNDFEDGAGKDADSYLVLANYQVNDDLSVTLRHSEVDLDGTDYDREKTTVAAGYAVTDNLSTVIEYSAGELGTADDNIFAVEGILTF